MAVGTQPVEHPGSTVHRFNTLREGIEMRALDRARIIEAAGLFAAVLLLAASGCTSPTDIDTAREKRYLDSTTSKRIQTRNVTISFTGASVGVPYAVVLNSPILIDTSKAISAVWIDAIADAPAGTVGDLPLRRLTVRIDSLQTDGVEYSMVDGTPPANTARFETEFPAGFTQQHTADGTSEKLGVALNHDRPARRLDGTIILRTAIGGRLMQVNGTITITY